MNHRFRWVVAPLLVVAMAVSASLSVTCRPHGSRSDLQAVSSQLKAQADGWDQAIIRKDLKAISDNMSADFRHISKSGERSDRAAFLRDIMAPDLVIHPYGVEDFDVRVYGDCALLCGRTRMTGVYQGKPFQSHYRYVDTYVRQDGKWVVCQVQISAIPD